MSMHLLGPWCSTINTKKRKPKRSKGWKLSERKHEKFLRSHGVHPDQLKMRTKKTSESYTYQSIESIIRTSDKIPGVCPKKETQTYTGEKIIGIAVMHKSNLVPVSKDDDPKSYARMRRN